MDVTAIGEILIDLTQTGINEAGVPQFSANPGGAPANVAVAASRLGARTAFLGKVGNDGFCSSAPRPHPPPQAEDPGPLPVKNGNSVLRFHLWKR